MPVLKPLLRLPWGRTILIGFASLLLLAALGWWSLRRQDAHMRSDLLSDARMAAKAIDWRHVQALTASEADLAARDYQRLKEQLLSIHAAVPQQRFIYLLGQRPDKSVFFYVDSEPTDSLDYSPPGQDYPEASDFLIRIFAAGTEAVEGPVKDRWGKWVSALVPVVDPQTGKAVALFGMDRDAVDWNRELALEVAAQVTLVVVLTMPLVVFLVLRQRNERNLYESRQYLSDIIQFFPDATMVIDRQGKVTAWNRAMEELTGVRAEAMLGRGDYAYARPFYNECRPILIDLVTRPQEVIEEQYPRIERQGNTLIGEAYIHNGRGDELYVQGTAATLRNPDGEIIGAIESVRDITVQKRMEADLTMARDAAEEASRLKSEFLANMSHEIRTPMNGVLGMTELLIDTELSPEQAEYVQGVKFSAESLLTVINDILDFSKIEARKLKLEPVNFNLRSSLGNILHTLAFRAAEKGLELAYHVPSDVPDAVVGDPGRLRQVIVNLVANAIKFTEAGEVILSVGTADGGEAGTVLHFTVADTGIGIAPEKQQAIFDPFTQADASTTRRYGGTGLGLTISARLVEMMGGRIWVESEIGRGSTFHFTARFGVQEGPEVRPVREEPASLQGLNVLVVDDNAANRQILAEMLKNWHMRPATAESGLTALRTMAQARLKGAPFRLLILDVNMPGMDGFELVERMRQRPDVGQPTIMMLTATGQRGDAARCRELGIAAYLTKPIGQSPLLDAILTVMGTTEPETVETSLVTLHSLREEERPMRVLLAEDNPVNRKIAVGMLERRGHSVVVAESGIEAVEAFRCQGTHPFDVILMDVQMPEMDGLEATAIIREEEKRTGGHLPIIALTAHVMEGDRENCLRVGMDGYVAKPLRAEELLAAMKGVLTARPPGASGESVRFPAAGEVFDREEALARVDGDGTLFREIVGIFLADAPKLLATISGALREKDPARLHCAAHTLKGEIGNFGARAACAATHRLEMMGKAGDLAAAQGAYATLETELERLNRSLAAQMEELDRENSDRR